MQIVQQPPDWGNTEIEEKIFLEENELKPNKYTANVVLYISIPRCLIVGALSLVMAYTTRMASSSIKDRAEVTYLSTTDVLTGAKNRLSYESKPSHASSSGLRFPPG